MFTHIAAQSLLGEPRPLPPHTGKIGPAPMRRAASERQTRGIPPGYKLAVRKSFS